MTQAPDDLIVTGPDYEQKDPQTFLVTPEGRPQTTLAQALADASGSVTVIRVQGGPFLIENTITTTGTVENSVGSLAAHGVLIGANADPVTATAAMGNAQLLVGQSGADPVPRTVGGDVTMNNVGQFALVASGVVAGTYGDATHVSQVTFDAAGRALTASNVAITGGGNVSNTGTPVAGQIAQWTAATVIEGVDFATALAGADLSGLSTSDPGGGKPWLNGGFLFVGAV